MNRVHHDSQSECRTVSGRESHARLDYLQLAGQDDPVRSLRTERADVIRRGLQFGEFSYNRDMDEQKTTKKPIPKREKASIHERAFIEKELLHSSMAQKELMNVVRELNHTMKELTKTLHLIEQHDFVDLHRKKWKLIAYNISLGILFAIGTVTGLFLISWFSYNFFKDSVILRQIVENQLKIRQLDMNEMKNRIKTEVTASPTKT